MAASYHVIRLCQISRVAALYALSSCFPAVAQTAASGADDCFDSRIPRAWSPRYAARFAEERRDKEVPTAYPDAALLPPGVDRTFLLGATVIEYTLLPIGRADNCVVLRSSKSDAIDRASCELLKRHVFLGPKIISGKPVASRQTMRVIWLPPHPPVNRCETMDGAIPVSPAHWLPPYEFSKVTRAINPGTILHLSVTVSPMGVPTDCKVVRARAAEAVQRQACELARKRMWLLPALDEHGNFRLSTVQLVLRIGQDGRTSY